MVRAIGRLGACAESSGFRCSLDLRPHAQAIQVALVGPRAVSLLSDELDEDAGLLEGLHGASRGGFACLEVFDGEGDRNDRVPRQELEELRCW